MNSEKEQKALDGLLRKTTKLPSLPSVAMRVLELAEDPNAGLSELAAVIINDPALSARLLRAANSPLYASRRQIDNMRQVVNLLGANATVTLALSFSLVPSENGGCVDKTAYWHRSLLAAISARVIAEYLKAGESGRFFLAALLQDIGRLVLEQAESEAYPGICEKSDSHDDLVCAEQNTFGFDHALLGSRLLQAWHLPDPLWKAIRCSHDLARYGTPVTSSLLERIVYLSGQVADFWMACEHRQEARILAQQMKAYLDLTGEDVDGILEDIAQLLPGYSGLFEVTLVSEQEISAILSEARDILILRNLKTLQEATDFKVRTEILQARNLELEQLAHSDPLTGLINRGRLSEILGQEFLTARSEGWPLSIGFIDIDYFKQVNDQYGHLAGDEVLRVMACEMRFWLRRTDVVARFGGEEFVLVLPGTGETEAYKMLERLRLSIEEKGYTIDGQILHLTVSIGLATYLSSDPKKNTFESDEDLVRAADRAVYLAKQAGRNRTIIYNKH